MLRTLFSKKNANGKGFKLKYNKEDDSWMVVKGHSIMFMGEELQCRQYLKNFQQA